MANLNSKLESFIATMKQGEEFAQYGYELLIKRELPESYFDALNESGLFDPKNNSGPVPADKEGFVRIPFWTALNYLEIVAKRAGELRDQNLAQKLLRIIRAVTQYRDAEGNAPDNYHTYYKFAEMLGYLPLASISQEEIDVSLIWLDSQYDHGLVATSLSKGLLARLIESGTQAHIAMACALMKNLMTYRWLPEKNKRGRELVTLVDDYWLKQIVDKYAKLLGLKAGYKAVRIFEEGLRAIFADSRRGYGSTLWRPAIESNSQNTDFRAPENRYVEGMRESLSGWLEASPAEAVAFVRGALRDISEIIRRIAINAVTERFDLLSSAIEEVITPEFFNSGHHHELYRLLNARFANFSDNGRRGVIDALRSLPKPKKGEDQERRLRYSQRGWLSAIKDHPDAVAWYGELSADAALGEDSDHPDFLSYHETRMGPGPAPFGESSIISYASDGTLIERLNSFEQKDAWRGPTLGGLIAALEAAVTSWPATFLPLLPDFRAAKMPFQYAVIEGFKRAFDKSKESKGSLNWASAWPKLMVFFRETLEDPQFWAQPSEQTVDLTPTRGWMTTLISSFLESGTREDETAYPPELLPQGWELIKILLQRAAPSEASLKDPMTHALNTEKGRAIGAMYNHALRVCRLAKDQPTGVTGGWETVRSVFDEELSKCRDDNFEFSALSASYIANIEFMSVDWLNARAAAIFPANFPANFKAALGGLAYATPTRRIFQLLAGNGILSKAMEIEVQNEQSRERLTEWICLAYLWGDETLESPLMEKVFASGPATLQDAAEFFWRVQGDKLTDNQIQSILAFWRKAVDWAKAQETPPQQLLSTLGRLCRYLTQLDAEGLDLLLSVVPYVHTDYSQDQMIKELSRFADGNPAGVARLLEAMIDASAPNYDFEDHLKRLLEKLFASGQRTETIRIVEKLRKSLTGMVALYKQLLAKGAES